MIHLDDVQRCKAILRLASRKHRPETGRRIGAVEVREMSALLDEVLYVVNEILEDDE